MTWVPPLLAALSALAVFLFALFILTRVNASVDAGKRERVLADYGRAESDNSEDEKASSSAIGAVIDRYRNNLKMQLSIASINVSAVNWMALQVGIAVIGYFLLSLRIHNSIASLIIAMLVSFFGTRAYVSSRIEKRIVEFELNLPQALQLLASGIRSGLSFEQAMETSATQDLSETGKQFRIAVAETQIDGQVEAALLRVSQRMKSDDLKWLVSALQIQRDIGGSLSSILDNVAETIRARADIRREVKVLSAEGKLSGYVLIAMPFVVLLALMIIRPNYVDFFWSNPIGIVMGIFFVALILVGWVWLKRIVKVKS
jgi:Flp pilus assembly protein TadB